MSLNMKAITQALAKTAAVIEKTVQTTVQEVTGPRSLQDYELQEQIASAGPGLSWKIFAAKPARGTLPSQHYSKVAVWVMDKRVLSEVRMRSGISKATEDAFLDIIRSDALRLVRLRHPGVIHVVHALDESKNAMAMVTEPLFACVANVLGETGNIEKLPKELKGMEMSILEIKHGLFQIAESLDFIHNNANLVHRAVAPENVLITSSGAWKISGFGFALPAGQNRGDLIIQPFHYPEYDVEDTLLPLQPSLNYIAPELVRSQNPSFGYYSDIFSLGCLAYHLIVRKPLVDCHNNIKMYINSLTYLSSASFSAVPRELVPDLQRMLSTSETSRPTAMEFTGSSFFRDDTRLRALRFLDHMLERDNMQKSDFLKALADMWKDFDSRILRYKVLPPLCSELRNVVMQPVVLPMVLTIAESQDRNEFEMSTLPVLLPVLGSASGETLVLLVRHADFIISKTGQENLVSHVLPMLVRAYEDSDSRLQEEALKRSVSLARQIDPQLVKQAILPRVHGLALRTTVAAVRVNALVCLSDLVAVLDTSAALDILQTMHRCTAVDRSASTLMCALNIAHSMFRQYGLEFALEHVLPLLLPLLSSHNLNAQQFSKLMLFIKDILWRMEEKRGVSLPHPAVAASSTVDETVKRGAASASSIHGRSLSWDADWASPRRDSPPDPPLAAITTASSSSVPSIGIEWPPPPPLQSVSVPNSLDDMDPFADWPPMLKQQPTTASGRLPVNGSNRNAVFPQKRKPRTPRLAPPPPPTASQNPHPPLLDLL